MLRFPPPKKKKRNTCTCSAKNNRYRVKHFRFAWTRFKLVFVAHGQQITNNSLGCTLKGSFFVMTYLGTDSDSKSFCLTYFWWYSTRKYLRYLFFECVFWCLTFLEWREGYQLALLISTSKVNSVWKSLGMMNWDAYCFKIKCLRKGQKTSVISEIEWNCALVEVRYGAIWLKKDGFAV